MKKTITLMLVILLGVGIALAGEKIYRSANILPQTAQTMLKKHFGSQGVSMVKVDSKTFGGKEYEVILNDGTEIEFNNSGEWTEVDCGHNAVPTGLVIKPIADFVKKNYSGAKIVHIEVKRSKYEVELNNGTELEFARDGRFLRVD